MTVSVRDPVRPVRKAVVTLVLLENPAAVLDVQHFEAVVHGGHQELVLVSRPGPESPHPATHVPRVKLSLHAPRVPESHMFVIATGQEADLVPDADHAGHPAAVAPGVAPHGAGLAGPQVVAAQFTIISPAIEDISGSFTGETGGPGLETVTLDISQGGALVTCNA